METLEAFYNQVIDLICKYDNEGKMKPGVADEIIGEINEYWETL